MVRRCPSVRRGGTTVGNLVQMSLSNDAADSRRPVPGLPPSNLAGPRLPYGSTISPTTRFKSSHTFRITPSGRGPGRTFASWLRGARRPSRSRCRVALSVCHGDTVCRSGRTRGPYRSGRPVHARRCRGRCIRPLPRTPGVVESGSRPPDEKVRPVGVRPELIFECGLAQPRKSVRRRRVRV